MKLSIKGKFIVASLAIVALVSGLIIFLLGVQKSLGSRMNGIIQGNLAAIRKAEQIKYHVVLYDDLIFRYLATDDRAFLSEAVDALEDAKMWIDDMKAIVEGPTEKEILNDIEKETTRYREGVQKLIRVYQSNKSDSQARTSIQKRGILNIFGETETPPKATARKGKENLFRASAAGKTSLIHIYSNCEKMVDIYRSKMDAAQEQMKQKIENTKSAVLMTGSVAFMAALVIVVLLALEILSPIQDLLDGIQKVAAGELDLELPVNSSDEIGRLTQHFNTMTKSLKEKQERLLTETITDPLTQLYNLRYFQDHLQSEILRAQRYNHPFCLLIVDIDYFKNFNDKNGHQMGNIILQQIARLLKDSVRKDGITARYGGEEFVLILPETSEKGGKIVAERLRATVEISSFAGQDTQPNGKLTVSVGGATFPEAGVSSLELFDKADKALYKAKNSGRNRIYWA